MSDNKKTITFQVMGFAVTYKAHLDKSLLGFISLYKETADGVKSYFNDLRLFTGKNGVFITEPSVKGKDGIYRKTYQLPQTLKDAILNTKGIKAASIDTPDEKTNTPKEKATDIFGI